MMRIGKLLPSLTNSQGDAENADALVKVLTWYGVDASLVVFEPGSHLESCNVYVLGHVTESDHATAQVHLGLWGAELVGYVSAGSVVLAVGSSLSLLTDVGLLGGVTAVRSERFVGDTVVEAETGLLWGFENSAQTYSCASDESAWGAVLIGSGNGDGTEGVRRRIADGLVLGTHLHGPVLVRNEEIMDEVIRHITKSDKTRVIAPEALRARELARENRAERIAQLRKS